jgi:hypothetical protein
MPNPTASDVHVNTPLTNISVAYMQDVNNFIAAKVFPDVPVTKQSDRYYTYDRGDFNRDEAEKRAPGTESAGGGYKIDNTPNYFADVWAFHKDIPDQVRDNSDAVLDPDREGTEFCTQKLLIRREKAFVTNYMAGSIWTGGDYTGVASAPGANQTIQWDQYNTSDPIGDVRRALTTVQQLTGFRPNTLSMGQQVWDALVDHPDVIDRVKAGQTPGKPAMGTKDALKMIWEIDNIYVAGSIINTAAEGATNSHSFIVGKVAWVGYVPPKPGLMTPSAGYTFTWTGFRGAAAGMGTRIKKFRMEHLESDRIEAQMAFAQKVVSTDLGFFWASIVG